MKYRDLPPSERPSDEPCQLCGHPWIFHVEARGADAEAEVAPCDHPSGECCSAYPTCECPRCGCVCFVSSYEVEEAEILT